MLLKIFIILIVSFNYLYADEESQIIYAPQLAITQEDINNALNYISKPYVNLTFKYNSGANNNTAGVEFFGTNKYIYGKGEINIQQDSTIEYIQLDPKVLIYGDMRYYSFNLAGSYLFFNNKPYMFLGFGITNPVFSLSYQKQYETNYDRFYFNSQITLFAINKVVYISFMGTFDYIYQNKYIKINPGMYLSFQNHSIGFEYMYKDIYFNNAKSTYSLVYKLTL